MTHHTPHPAHRMALLLGTLLALVAAGLTTGLTAGTAEAARGGATPDKAWSGFRIPATGDAAGSWIGARKLPRREGGRIAYRIDPRADPQPGGFGPARAVERLRGPGQRASATPAVTSRAAWIVSKYGAFDFEIQSAAVDAALLHLLVGGRYQLSGRDGAARLRATGQATRIRAFAATMLRDSARLAGPYAVRGTQVGQNAVGTPLRVALSAAVARSGRGVRSLPVSVRANAGGWRAAGSTDDAGRRTATLTGLPAGPNRVAVRVDRVPETRLHVLEPSRAAGSRTVLAGRKRSLTTTFTVAVKARQRAAVRTAGVPRGTPTTPRLRVSAGYDGEARAATATLYGPFASRQGATCRGPAVRTLRTTVAGDGERDLPALTVQRAGVYVWDVAVAGSTYNLPARACSGIFRVARGG